MIWFGCWFVCLLSGGYTLDLLFVCFSGLDFSFDCVSWVWWACVIVVLFLLLLAACC